MDAVTEVISGRAQAQDSMQSMLGASVLAHVVLVGLVFFAPAGPSARPPDVVMTISLGGPVGPNVGGITQMGGRPVQAIAETKRAIEPVRPPAARAPEMIEPKKTAPKKSEAKVQTEAKTPSSRTPTKGDEPRPGSAASAWQNARGQGSGFRRAAAAPAAFCTRPTSAVRNTSR
jgi:hypothetical protein